MKHESPKMFNDIAKYRHFTIFSCLLQPECASFSVSLPMIEGQMEMLETLMYDKRPDILSCGAFILEITPLIRG